MEAHPNGPTSTTSPANPPGTPGVPPSVLDPGAGQITSTGDSSDVDGPLGPSSTTSPAPPPPGPDDLYIDRSNSAKLRKNLDADYAATGNRASTVPIEGQPSRASMQVVKIHAHGLVAGLEPLGDPKTVSRIRGTRGLPVEDWTVPTMGFVLTGPEGTRRPADVAFTCAGNNYPAFHPRVREQLESAAGITEQWLPLKVRGSDERYAIYNCTDWIEAIDPDRSDLKYKSRGRIAGVELHVFDPEAIGDRWLFRDVLYPPALYATDRFVDHAFAQGWTGLWFIPIWDSRHEKFRYWPTKEDTRTRPEIWGPEGIAARYGVEWGR